MSPRAENHALEVCGDHARYPQLRAVHAAVLHHLAIRHNDHHGYAWPSIQRVALETRYTERAVYKAIDDLVAWGLLYRSWGRLPMLDSADDEAAEQDGRKLRGNVYRFPAIDRIPQRAAPRLAGGRPRSDEPGSSDADAGSDEPDATTQMNPAQRSDEPGDSPLPLKEPALKPALEQGAAQCDECLRIVRPDGFGHMQVCRDYRVPPTSPRFRARAATSGADAAVPQGVAHGPAAA